MSDKAQEKHEEEKPKFKVIDRRHTAADGEPGNPVEAPEEQLPSYVQQLKNEAEEKDKRLREYIAAFKNKSAEMEEFRLRLQRENEAQLDRFKANFFSQLVPILDNLKRAADTAQNNSDFDSLKHGIQMIVGQFTRNLEENGVQQIRAKGRKFDPATDEACMTVETNDPEQDNIVLEELEPGYMFNDKLIKPVKVKVGKAV